MMEMNNERDQSSAESGRSGPSPALIGFGIVAIVAIIFVFQNSDEVETKFLFLDFTSRVWFTILVAMVLGALLDRLLQIWWRRRRND